MEVRVYRSMQDYTVNKSLFCSRVECPDAFSYFDTLSVFRSIYGIGIVIVVIAL